MYCSIKALEKWQRVFYYSTLLSIFEELLLHSLILFEKMDVICYY